MSNYDEAAVKRDLDGVMLDYKYPGEQGPHYVVSINTEKLDFFAAWPGEPRLIPPTPPPLAEGEEALPPPEGGVDYRARKIQEGLYLVHWIVMKKIHVALLFDFMNKQSICAALMPGQTELWDVAYWDRWIIPSAALQKYQGTGRR